MSTKSVQTEVHCCDACGKEFLVTACICCGKEYCYDCRKREGKEYSQGVHFSGSGDGYYCNPCDAKLTASGSDKLHAAYRAVASLRIEGQAWGEDFQRRCKAAEANVLRAVEDKP